MNKESFGTYYYKGYKEGLGAGVSIVGQTVKSAWKPLSRRETSYRSAGVFRKWGRRALVNSGLYGNRFVQEVLYEFDRKSDEDNR